MSIHYLLDGYNVIHQTAASNLGTLEEQRLYLIHFIERQSPQGSLKNSVTIVFDGRPEFYGRVPSSVARVVFSEYESADDKIKKIVTEARNRKNITVVTDDRDIQYAVRALGAKASSVKAFLSRGKASTKKKGSGEPAKYISKVDETKITSEMQKIWLKPNG